MPNLDIVVRISPTDILANADNPFLKKNVIARLDVINMYGNLLEV